MFMNKNRKKKSDYKQTWYIEGKCLYIRYSRPKYIVYNRAIKIFEKEKIVAEIIKLEQCKAIFDGEVDYATKVTFECLF